MDKLPFHVVTVRYKGETYRIKQNSVDSPVTVEQWMVREGRPQFVHLFPNTEQERQVNLQRFIRKEDEIGLLKFLDDGFSLCGPEC